MNVSTAHFVKYFMTYHCNDGVTLSAVGVLIVHCVNNAITVPTHQDTKRIVKYSLVSFYINNK